MSSADKRGVPAAPLILVHPLAGPTGAAEAPVADGPVAGETMAEASRVGPPEMAGPGLPCRAGPPEMAGPAAPLAAAPVPPAARSLRQHPTVRVVGAGCAGVVRLTAVVLLALSGFVAAAGILLAIALASGPVPLPDWVTARVERAMNGVSTAGRVSLGRIEIGMAGEAPRISLRDVGLYDDRGAEVVRLNDVGAGFSFSSLIHGDIVPGRLRLVGAQMTLRRREDGSFDLSFGAEGAAVGSLAEVLDRIDGMFAAGPLSRIREVTATDLTITLQDARVSRIWQVTGGRMTLTQTPEQVEIAVSADVFNGTDSLATTSLDFRAWKQSSRAEVSARFDNAAAGDIALQSPVLAFLTPLDAPISGALRVALDDRGALTDFAGTLKIGAGRLTPGGGNQTVHIGGGSAYFSYAPKAQRIDFSDLSINSDAVTLGLTGSTYLQDLRPDGRPGSLVGQFRITSLAADPRGLLDQPLKFQGGQMDLQLQLDPFKLTLGRLRLTDGGTTATLSGTVEAQPGGVALGADFGIDRIDQSRLLALWPKTLAPKTRDWLAQNIQAGTVTDAHGGFRHAPDGSNHLALGFRFDHGRLTFMDTMPAVEDGSGYVSIDGDRLVVRAEKAQLTPPQGGTLDGSGTTFTVPDMRAHPARAEVRIQATGPVTAGLSLLDQPPLQVMTRAERPVTLADGRARVTASVDFPFEPHLTVDDVRYDARAAVEDVGSGQIVEGHDLAADSLTVTATNEGVSVGGAMQVGAVPADVVWKQALGAAQGDPGTVTGTVRLDQAALDEFGIALPSGMVSGRGSGTLKVVLPHDGAPRFTLTSDLRGVALRLPAIGWSKPAAAAGGLVVEGTLGDRPSVDRLEIRGGGLEATGKVALTADGGLDRVTFSRVRIGGWLDAPVTLVGRGRGALPAVQIGGGTLDLRRANFGSDASGGGSGAMPITVALDRLRVTDSISLTGFRGDFTTAGGFNGQFTGKLNGGGTVAGVAAPQNGGTAIKVTSQDAGSVLKDAQMAQRIRGGAMTLILTPTGQEGTYDGYLTAQRIRVRGTPALAELLNAVSVVGLLQQLNGDGIVFDQVDAHFLMTPNALNFRDSSAVGASLGISVDGSYSFADSALDLQGVFSPVYLLNGIGQIFSRRGEGLFGFNYSVKGTPDEPQVSVNPLSLFTPGMFRQLFRGAPPKVK